jgi:hypothetical protein
MMGVVALRVRLVACGLLGLLFAACPVGLSGDFAGAAFAPTELVFAVYDRHALLPQGGSVVAAEMPASQRKVHLFFSAAQGMSPMVEWKRVEFSRLLSFKKDLAERDGLLILDLPVEKLQDGTTLELQVGGPTNADGSSAHLVARASQVPEDRGLGSDITATLEVVHTDLQTNGLVQGSVVVRREKGEDQPGDVRTGEVKLDFVANLAPERVGKSNLALAAPILICASQKGPARAAGCREVGGWAEVDATGTHRLP